MRQMNISDKAKRQFHIVSGNEWTPSHMGDNICAFNMADMEKVDEFKNFLIGLGFRRITVVNGKVYGHTGSRG